MGITAVLGTGGASVGTAGLAAGIGLATADALAAGGGFDFPWRGCTERSEAVEVRSEERVASRVAITLDSA
jgi:hypothetical protein